MRRHFAMEQFAPFRSVSFDSLRSLAAEEYSPDIGLSVSGSDIDQEAVKLSRRHIHQAGLEGIIRTSVLPLQQLSLQESRGVFICNPPYGERLSDQQTCRALYRDLRSLKERHPGWSMCVISSDPAFERYFGKKASKKRRLYNGRLECTYYIFP